MKKGIKCMNRHTIIAVLSLLAIMVIFVSCANADMESRQQPSDTSSSSQPTSTSTEQPDETASEYTKIVHDSLVGYWPTMSWLRGLPIEFAMDNISTVVLSCDHGSFLSYKDEYKASADTVTLDGGDIASHEEEYILYWVPFNTAGTIEDIQSADVEINAVDTNGNRYHQTMRVLQDETYMIFNMLDTQNVPLSSPSCIHFKKDNKTTILYPPQYARIAYIAAQRIGSVETVEKAALDMTNDDVDAWKQQYDWIELYYPKKYLAGVFVGSGDSKIELMAHTRILMFLDGEFADCMFLYSPYDDDYSVPIFIGKFESIPGISFDKTYQSTAEREDVSFTLYAYTKKRGEQYNIYLRAEITNIGSDDMVLDTSPYITLNVTSVGDMIGEQYTNQHVTLGPNHTLDVGVTVVEVDTSGTYTLSGQFGEYALPPLDVVVE